MNLKLITIIGILAVCYSCNAQQKKRDTLCFQKARGFIQNRLPDDVCIKKGELIYTLFNKFDFNSDGLRDLAIEKGSDSLVNGSQKELVVYQKINDTTFIKFRKLDNVYPLWFENYDPSVKVKDPKLNHIKEYYEGNPLRKISLSSNKIILNLNGDAITEYILTYVYSNEKKIGC